MGPKMIARPRLVENKLLTLLGVFQTLFSVGCKYVNFAYVLPIFAWWANKQTLPLSTLDGQSVEEEEIPMAEEIL